MWEPFILEWQGDVVLYYSDQRDPDHGQKLVHQVSSDLKTWGDVVDDYADDAYESRPGMTTIAELPNGQFILTYEYYGAEEADFAVYYRLSDDPTKFAETTHQVIRTSTDTIPVGSPYVVWSSAGGDNGTIVVSSGTQTPVYINRALGDPDAWVELATVAASSYTRSLLVLPDQEDILIVGGGVLNGSNNVVSASTVNVAA